MESKFQRKLREFFAYRNGLDEIGIVCFIISFIFSILNVIFPKISPETFYESARQLDSLLRVATTLSYEINNTDIGREIVEAAQKSETDKIYAILRNAGITGGLKITYTPYGITFTVLPKGQTAPIRTYASIHLTWQDLL